MKKIVQYKCELCWDQFYLEKNAIACESQWKIDRSLYPIGLMYEYHHNWYVGILAIAELYEWDWWRDQHLLHTSARACRPHWDTLWEEKCSWEFVRNDIEKFKKHHFISDEYRYTHEFERMVYFLKENWIQPQYYDEKWELQIVDL